MNLKLRSAAYPNPHCTSPWLTSQNIRAQHARSFWALATLPSLRSRRQHKAWGVSPRYQAPTIIKPAERAIAVLQTPQAGSILATCPLPHAVTWLRGWQVLLDRHYSKLANRGKAGPGTEQDEPNKEELNSLESSKYRERNRQYRKD